MTEAELLRIFDEHHLPLFRFAFRLTGSSADAEDIVQECFLALLRSGSRFDPRRGPLRTYLFGAVRNQAVKRLRNRPVEGDGGQATDDRSPETHAEQEEIARRVERAVMRLPGNQREVLILAHYEQMAAADIAELLGLEVGAVKSRLQRARASLKEMLAAFAPERKGSQ